MMSKTLTEIHLLDEQNRHNYLLWEKELIYAKPHFYGYTSYKYNNLEVKVIRANTLRYVLYRYGKRVELGDYVSKENIEIYLKKKLNNNGFRE